MDQKNLVPRPALPAEEPTSEEINWGRVVRNSLFATWSVARAVLILLCSLMIVAAVGLYAVQYVQDHYLSPPGDGTNLPVQVIIAKGSTLSGVSKLMEAEGLVRNGTVFKYYLDFSGYADKIKAGTYIFNDTMSMSQIADSLMRGNENMTITGFTIPEGSSVDQIAAILVKQGILKDSTKFLQLCKTGDKFIKYDFVKDVLSSKNFSQRRYALEGYLFPATYEIYAGSSEETIINKMLSKYNSVMDTKSDTGVTFRDRAKELNYSVDEITTLASMIQRESLPEDHAGASAVFYNRLKVGMKLQSDVTVLYAINQNKLTVNETDRGNPSPYNTYKYKGIPLGPITNPGEAAIEAALYPDEQKMADKYLYFVVSDPRTGRLAFSKTQKEHDAYYKEYQRLLDEMKKQTASPSPDTSPTPEPATTPGQ